METSTHTDGDRRQRHHREDDYNGTTLSSQGEMTFDDGLPVDTETMLNQCRDQLRRLGERVDKWCNTQGRGSPPSDARRVRFYEKPRRRTRDVYRQRETRRNDVEKDDDNNRNGVQQQSTTDLQLGLRLHQEKEDCTRCGHPGGHKQETRCYALNKHCYLCSSLGHLARCCFKAPEVRKGHTLSREQE